MHRAAATVCSMSHLTLNAEALYLELLRGVRSLCQANTRLVGITSGGAWLAERLQADCQLAAFRKDEAARIIQDAMDWEINSMLTMLRTHPNAVHLNILRGQFLLTREQALHIAGASDYDKLKTASWQVKPQQELAGQEVAQ